MPAMKSTAKTTSHCRQMSLCKAESSAGSTASVRPQLGHRGSSLASWTLNCVSQSAQL